MNVTTKRLMEIYEQCVSIKVTGMQNLSPKELDERLSKMEPEFSRIVDDKPDGHEFSYIDSLFLDSIAFQALVAIELRRRLQESN